MTRPPPTRKPHAEELGRRGSCASWRRAEGAVPRKLGGKQTGGRLGKAGLEAKGRDAEPFPSRALAPCHEAHHVIQRVQATSPQWARLSLPLAPTPRSAAPCPEAFWAHGSYPGRVLRYAPERSSDGTLLTRLRLTPKSDALLKGCAVKA